MRAKPARDSLASAGPGERVVGKEMMICATVIQQRRNLGFATSRSDQAVECSRIWWELCMIASGNVVLME